MGRRLRIVRAIALSIRKLRAMSPGSIAQTFDSPLLSTWHEHRLKKPALALNNMKSKSHAGRNGKGKSRRWSAAVTRQSNAMDLRPGIFRSTSPRKIAKSVKSSAERSKRRKGTAYQSAMSMLNFYLNRAGNNLPRTRRDILERAKRVLQKEFGRA